MECDWRAECFYGFFFPDFSAGRVMITLFALITIDPCVITTLSVNVTTLFPYLRIDYPKQYLSAD